MKQKIKVESNLDVKWIEARTNSLIHDSWFYKDRPTQAYYRQVLGLINYIEEIKSKVKYEKTQK